MKRVLILGAGFGGLETATGLGAALGDGYEITLVDKRDAFYVGFAKIDVMFGHRSEEAVSSRYTELALERVRFVKAEITAIDPDARRVETSAGAFDYDYLVVALGADLNPGATPGFPESGGHEFYSMAGAVRLGPVMESFSEGTFVLAILGAPYKCPPAPYEVAYQIHDRFVARGVRDRITMKMVIPGPRPVPNPAVATALEQLLQERNIELVTKASVSSVDAANKKLVLADRSIDYDLLVGVPVHGPPAVVRASKLVDKGYIEPSTINLETKYPGVYAVGDVTKLPVGDAAVPKAGAFAEDAARTVVSDILVKEGLRDALVKFEARGTCYFELGSGAVGKVNANYYGGDKPVMTLDGPSDEYIAQKKDFESSRRGRWFKTQ